VQAAIGGQAVTQVFEGEKTFALTVRWLPQYRGDVNAMRSIAVSSPDGSQIPLAQLATITEEDSPYVVWREDGKRYTPVKFSVRGRDLASTIEESLRKISSAVHLPPETILVWGGEINELRAAEARLLVILPITLLLIAFLVFSAVRNWFDTLIVLINIPVACSGGILALLIARENLSVSAAMGFVSIFGIAVQDALLMVTYFQQLYVTGLPYTQAARQAAEKRFRPVLMTTLVATLGLLPAALSHGIGAQAQRPLALVVIGGSLVVAFLTRIIQPPLLVMVHRRFPYAESEPSLKPIPNIPANEIVALVESLDAHDGPQVLSKLASQTARGLGELTAVVDAAEMLGLVEKEKKLVGPSVDGARFAKASVPRRKELWRELLGRVQMFRYVLDALGKAEQHRIHRDFVLELIALHLPREKYEYVFDTMVDWARYGSLFEYDEQTREIAPRAIEPRAA
jgi:cobalt-zinc-cadmium resistance protein CzcA